MRRGIGARHVMTPKRKVALKKAQLISARKRRRHGGPTPTARRRRAAMPRTTPRRKAAAPKRTIKRHAAIGTTKPRQKLSPINSHPVHRRPVHRTGGPVHNKSVKATMARPIPQKRGMSTRKKVALGVVGIGTVAAVGAVAYQGHKVYQGQQNARDQALNHRPKKGVKTLYHLTHKEHVESILKTGIRPSHYKIDFGGGSGFVHVTENVVEARNMAARFQGPEIAILAVKVKGELLQPDVYEGGAPHYRIRPHGVLGVRLTRGSGGGATTPNLSRVGRVKRAEGKAKAKKTGKKQQSSLKRKHIKRTHRRLAGV